VRVARRLQRRDVNVQQRRPPIGVRDRNEELGLHQREKKRRADFATPTAAAADSELLKRIVGKAILDIGNEHDELLETAVRRAEFAARLGV